MRVTEIESFVDYAVTKAVTHEPSQTLDSASIVERLVQALSSDSSWVELYVTTGELIIPKVVSDDEKLDEASLRAIEVRIRPLRCVSGLYQIFRFSNVVRLKR